jgi:hypothetical protein
MVQIGHIDKEYTWPESFPECITALRTYSDEKFHEQLKRKKQSG